VQQQNGGGKMNYQLLVLETESGYEALAYTKYVFSKKEVRRLTKKFRNDADVIDAFACHWERFYDTVEEMKKDLPEL
jgi:hypothetical protein